MKEAPDLRTNFLWNERFVAWISALLISLMMFCFGYSVQKFGERLGLNWTGWFLPFASLMFSLEAIATRRVLRHKRGLSFERISAFLAEFIVIAIILRLFFAFMWGFETGAGFFENFEENFIGTLFAADYLYTLFYLTIVWVLSGQMAEDWMELEGDQEILSEGANPLWFTDRRDILRSISSNIFLVGSILIILTAGTRVQLEAIWGDILALESSTLNVILFFIFGLVLLSLGQFSVLRASWGWERLPISRELAANWTRYSVLFLMVLLVLVIFLPTGYSIGFLDTLWIIFQFVLGIFSFILVILLIPIVFLISLFSGFNYGGYPSLQQPLLPFQNLLDPGSSAPLFSYWEIIRSILFWTFFLAIIGFAFFQYARQNESVWKRLMNSPVWGPFIRGLIRFWIWIRRSSKHLRKEVQDRIERIRISRIGVRAGDLFRYIRFNSLTHRQQVLFIYYALLKRGADAGVSRGDIETALEYAERVSTGFS